MFNKKTILTTVTTPLVAWEVQSSQMPAQHRSGGCSHGSVVVVEHTLLAAVQVTPRRLIGIKPEDRTQQSARDRKTVVKRDRQIFHIPVDYRNHAGQRTGVRSFFKSCRSCFCYAPRCDNADGCDNADTGAEKQLNHFVMSFSAPPVR